MNTFQYPPVRCSCPPSPCPGCRAAGTHVPRAKGGRHTRDRATVRQEQAAELARITTRLTAVRGLLLAAGARFTQSTYGLLLQPGPDAPGLRTEYAALIKQRQYHQRRLRALATETSP